MSSHSYLVPDYYTDFKCKGGACNHTCCSGWRITLSMRKYFELLGLSCSPELRDRLDRAFCVCDNPTPERYAQIVPNYAGDCPVRNEEGLCALQLERGEGVLTEACRYYPRSMRSEYRYECSCANSCEAVIELLLFRREAMKFKRMRLSFRRDSAEERKPEGSRRDNAVRGACIALLHDRSRPFSERMIKLGEYIESLSPESADKAGSNAGLTYSSDDNYALSVLNYLMNWYKEARPESAACEYFAEAQNYLGLADYFDHNEVKNTIITDKYKTACEEFGRHYPDFDTMAEQIMVNHAFYIGFPYGDRRRSLYDEYAALCVVYGLFRLLTVCCHAVGGGDRKVIDAIAASFRLIEHSRFEHNTAILLRRIGCVGREKLSALLMI